LQKADADEIARRVPGIGMAVAEKIMEHLQRKT
jgi:DNA uptake protein ComE-like DNA-binding protein